MDILYVVVPCYNEEEVLPITASHLVKKLEQLISEQKIHPDSRILFVDDGSRDKTWELISELHSQQACIHGLKLTRNKGHQNALLAGLFEAEKHADIIVSMDADLQDDIHAIDAFVDQYHQGYEIVFGVRQSRSTDTVFKRNTAQVYYRLLKLLGVNIVYNHADYRLMSKRAVAHLAQFDETNLFLRGVIPLIGLKSTSVFYDRHERVAGESKYPLKKMLAFAFEGITSFSIKPIRMITSLGFLMSLGSIFYVLFIILDHFMGWFTTVRGWNTLVVSIWFLGGLQLLAMGVVGEYIGKIYLEVKHRPRYLVEEYLGNKK